jgi:ABC-2 type transport system permease protein
MTTHTTLQAVERSGPLTNINLLMTREHAKWWRSRRWWTQTALWLVLLSAFAALIYATVVIEGGIPGAEGTASDPTLTAEIRADAGNFVIMNVTGLASTLMAIAVIILTSGHVINELERGITAWLLSKPTTRTAYVLAKILPDALGYLVTMLVIPLTVVYVAVGRFIPVEYTALNFGLTLLVILVLLMFWHSFTLMVSIVARSTQIALGVALGLNLFGPQLIRLFAGQLPEQVVTVIDNIAPWNLATLIPRTLDGGIDAISAQATLLIATLGWMALNYAISVWAMRRLEP